METKPEHPYTALLRRHRALIAAGLVSPYGQMKRRVLSKAQQESQYTETLEQEQNDDEPLH